MNLLDRTDSPDVIPVLVHRPRRLDRILARLRAATLDRQLAGGRSPDDDGHRAVRAAQLVAPEARWRLAEHWEGLLDRAARPHSPGDPRLPLPRARILAVEADIRHLAARLRVATPPPVRGVAMAHRLLTDGSGPLYARGSCASLQDAISAASHYLDPATTLTGSTAAY